MSVVRGSVVRSSRLWVMTAAVALVLTACSDSPDDEPTPAGDTASPSAPVTTPSTSPTTDSPSTEPPVALPSLDGLLVSPGRIGPVVVAMSKQQALDTGLLEADVEVAGEDCGRVQPLAWKANYASSLDVLTKDDGTIVSLGIRGEQPRTSDGLGVGSTLREVSQVHETAELVEAGYGQTGVFVTEGERWLGYLFDADPESIGPKDTVTLVEVTQGTKPDLMRDGC